LWIPTPINRKFAAARAELRLRLGAILESAKEAGRGDTLLARLLAEKDAEALSSEQFIDECITLLVAGHETSALALCYALHSLAMHPLAQRRLHEELVRTGVPETVRDCQRSGVLRNTLTETLRLYPVAWALGREVHEAVTIEGHLVLPGTQVYIHQWQAHRHPAYFDKSEQFLPERWTEDFARQLPKNLYAPFGAGPRICIGNHFALAEMSVVLARLLRDHEFTRHSTAPLELRASITVRPRWPLLLRVRRRSAD
jgi:cytochrome P450